jgi:hypothetical protein
MLDSENSKPESMFLSAFSNKFRQPETLSTPENDCIV